MVRVLDQAFLAAALFAIAATIGCNSRPGRISPPSVDADSAASEAMKLLDKNSDGKLDGGELAASPGLASAKERYDADHGGSLDEAEIAAGIRRWSEGKLGAASVPYVIQWNGAPLTGAEVKLIPEPFLGDAVKGAVGVERRGSAFLSVKPEDRPSGAPNAPIVQPGLYRVEITHPSVQIPAKYNTSTTLGVEIAQDTLSTGGITWSLTR
jgi:hypothetical protein